MNNPRRLVAIASAVCVVASSATVFGIGAGAASAATVPFTVTDQTYPITDPTTRALLNAAVPGDTIVITASRLTPFAAVGATPAYINATFTGDATVYHAAQTSPTTYTVVVPANAITGNLTIADNGGNNGVSSLQIWATHSEPYVMPSGHLNITAGDLQYILDQIKIGEAHSARTATPAATLASAPSATIRYPYDITSATRCLQAADITAAGTATFGATGLSNVYPYSTTGMWGVRQVDGQCNNIANVQPTTAPVGVYQAPNLNPADTSPWGSSDQLFTRLAPGTNTPTAGTTYPTLSNTQKAYQNPNNSVKDATPRMISNLIADQSTNNPAAVSASSQAFNILYGSNTAKLERAVNATTGAVTKVASIPNITPDYNVSAGYNSWFTLFGQFYDHGLDLIPKTGAQVYIPLSQSDPLYVASPTAANFMILTRAAQSQYNGDSTNNTTPYVDQSQSYGSHPAQNFFLREYVFNAAGKPTTNGRLLDGTDTAYSHRAGGADLPTAWANNLGIGGTLTNPGVVPTGETANNGMPTWRDIKAQARLLGINLDDVDVDNIPIVATDQYGNFIGNPNAGATQGMPMMLFSNGTQYVWASGTSAAPLSTGKPSFSNPTGGISLPGLSGANWKAVLTGHNFINDTMNSAVPTAHGQPLAPDADTILDSPLTPVAPGTYDNENLDAHFVAGDGRINENIGLQAVHNTWHSEHNLVENDIATLLTNDPAVSAAFRNEWHVPGGAWNGQRLYMASRLVMEMEYQHMVFGEFIRRISPALPLFLAYDQTINSSITNEFASSVYRLGHSMLNETIARSNPGTYYSPTNNQDVSLITGFTNPMQARLPRPAIVASAVASGSTITYTLAAKEAAPLQGEIVSIAGMDVNAYNVSNAVVDSAVQPAGNTPGTFTVSTFYPGGTSASAAPITAPVQLSSTSKQAPVVDVVAPDATGAFVTLNDTSSSPNIATVAINDPGTGGAANLYSPETAIGMVAQGMSSQRGQEIDEFTTDAVRNNLLGLPLDLATLNITRGRDVGLPTLNQFREQNAASLPPYQSWVDYGLALRYPESLTNFVAAYGTHPTITGPVTIANVTGATAVANGADATVTYSYAGQGGKDVAVGDQVTVTGLSGYNVTNGIVSAVSNGTFTVSKTMSSGNQDVKGYAAFGGPGSLLADAAGTPVPFTSASATGAGSATREPNVDERRAAAQILVDAAAKSDNTAPNYAVDFMNGIGTYASTETGIDNVDLWIGGLAENPMKQPVTPPMLGPTFQFVFDDQSLKLQNGDRFYYLGRLAGTNLGEEIPAQLFTDIVRRNTPTASNKGTLGMVNPGFGITDCAFSNNAALVPAGTDPFSGAPTQCGGMTTSARTGAIIHTGLDNVTGFADPQSQVGAKLTGGAGDDSIQGTPLNDTLSGGTSGGDTITGFAGNDNIQGGPGEELIQGGPGADTINSGESQLGDTVDGGSGSDAIYNGNATGPFVSGIGETGDDFIQGGKGADLLLEGGEGSDWIEGAADLDLINGDMGPVGGGVNPQIPGGNDVVSGGAGNDLVGSDGGDDIALAGDGADIIDTGTGFDWVNYQYNKRLDNGGTKPSVYVDGTGALFPNPTNQPGDGILNAEGISGTPNNDVLIGGQGADITIAGVNGTAGVPAITLPGLVTTVIGGMSVSGPGIAPNAQTIGVGAAVTVNGVTSTVIDLTMPNTANIVNASINFTTQPLTNPNSYAGLAPLLQNTPGWTKYSSVTPGATSWSGGTLLFGGGGSDKLQLVAGENVVDGSDYLNACILVKGGTYTTGSDVTCGSSRGFSSMSVLTPLLDNGTLVASDLQTVREIRQSAVAVTAVQQTTANAVVYTVASNPFSVGDSVTVRNLAATGVNVSGFNVVNATVTAVTPTSFTIAKAGTAGASIPLTAGAAKATDTLVLPLAANQYTLLPVTNLPAGVLTGVQVVDLTGQNIDTVYNVDMVSYAGAAAVPFYATAGQMLTITSSVGTFSPVFTGGTLTYQLVVPTNTTTLTLTPTVDNPGTTVTVNGAAVASGTASGAIAVAAAGTATAITVVGTPPSVNATPTVVHPAIPTTTYNITVVRAGLTPTLSAVTLTTTGFTFNVTNYSNLYTWQATTTLGQVAFGAANGAVRPVTVTGLTAGQTATVTITTSRTGYSTLSATATGTAAAGRVSTFSTPVQTATGFTFNVTNGDSPTSTYTCTVTVGTCTAGAVTGTAPNQTMAFTVAGLTAGQSSAVTMTTTRTGWLNGVATLTSSALNAALNSTFGTTTGTTTGFTTSVTNYDANFTYALSTTAGAVAWSGAATGATRGLTVTGLTAGQSATITVATTRTGYAAGSATQAGTAVGAARNTTVSTTTPTVDGFTFNVTNYSNLYTYTCTVPGGTCTPGVANGATLPVTVTGLAAGSTATAVVTTSRTGFASGTVNVAGATTGAVLPGLVSTFGTATRNGAGTTLTVNVTNYDPAYTYALSSTGGTVAWVAAANGTTRRLRVTGLTNGVNVTVTVTTTRTGYSAGVGTVTG